MAHQKSQFVPIMFSCLMVAGFASVSNAKEYPETASQRTIDDARQVYDHLLKEYDAGQTGVDRLELLNTWSMRIMTSEFSFFNSAGKKVDPERLHAFLKDHIARLGNLEKKASALASQGKISSAEAAAARILLQQASELNQRVQQETKSTSSTISLPKAKYKPIGKKALYLNVDKDGNVHLDGKAITREELKEKLSQLHAADPTRSEMVLRIHKDCLVEHVSALSRLCNEAGFTSLKIGTSDE